MRMTTEEMRASEEIEAFIMALEDSGFIQVRNPDFLRRQFNLLATGNVGGDLHDIRIGVLQALRRCSG